MSTKRNFHSGASKALSLLMITAVALFALAAPGAYAQGTTDGTSLKGTSGTYIVQLKEPPVSSYTGGVAGIPGTQPGAGQGIDRSNPNVQRYMAYLAGKHDALLGSVGGARKVYSYGYLFNGFAAQLSGAQVARLAASPEVAAVTPDEIRSVDTVSTPDFLGLTARGGLWSQLGGASNAGSGVVVGIVDGGIWPESASFADNGSFGRPGPRWRGTCVSGEQWDPAANCSNKIIGARYYNAGFGGDQGIKDTWPWEFNSPRDFGGHGSHTASTAAGNNDVRAEAEGSYLGQASGMAPGAQIAVYKVCWETGAGGTCATSDSVAAIEDATVDGVDVINYSISGTRTNYNDPVEIAFLQAAGLGVFVAASAGNSGPGATTVAHISPWLTSVAAGTHDRDYVSSVTLGNGAVYSGKSLGSGTPSAPLISATEAGLPGANATAVRLCFAAVDNGGTPVLDPAKVAGKIVICDRGTTARVNKSRAVKEAGGIGVILTNTSPSSVNADLHFIPTLHTDEVAGAAIKAYASSAGASATAQIAPGTRAVAEAPTVAAFSSRGPSLAGGGDILKPDIMGPGVDVLAAVAPPGNSGRSYDFYSGTSMSSPHIAGLAALLKDVHPTWTPMMIKSALMTTASQTTNAGNAIPGDPFGYGAGQVAPNSAVDPGLVYASSARDWVAFLCGQKLVNDPRCPLIAIDASDLNQASIAIGDLAGIQTVNRTVTNVSDRAITFVASVAAPAGIQVQVSPPALTLAPGQSKSFQVKFTTQAGAALGGYSFGSLTWTGGKYSVRSPLAIRPVALAAPAELSASGASGSSSYSVKFGYAGPFAARPHGLVPATAFNATLTESASDFVPGSPSTVSFDVNIPAGTEYARFALFDDAASAGSDLDLYVYRGSTQVGGSGGGTAAEQVNLVKPAAGTYTVWVHAYSIPAGGSTFTQFNWAITPASAGNLTVSAPASATIGASGNISLSWSGLSASTRYLGTVTYHNVAAPSSYDDGRIATTIVGVNVP